MPRPARPGIAKNLITFLLEIKMQFADLKTEKLKRNVDHTVK